MSRFIAALPMYDWPESRAEVDALWRMLRDSIRSRGVDAPDNLVRRNADMPPMPGGIRDHHGNVVVRDPATLPPDDLDFETLWRHPRLLFAQTCWGPLETTDLGDFVTVIGQPDYSGIVGGAGALYSSAIVMPKGGVKEWGPFSMTVPESGIASLPLDLLRGKRLAFNSHDSMSGIIAITRDLDAMGEGIDMFSERIETGGHRLSIKAVAEGRADVAAIDCLSWDMAQRHEPAAQEVEAVGWTALRKGLPFITSKSTPDAIVRAVQAALHDTGLTVAA